MSWLGPGGRVVRVRRLELVGAVGGVEGAGPGVLPGPGFEQVPGDLVSSAAGGSAGDADELGADGGAAGYGVAGGGQCS